MVEHELHASRAEAAGAVVEQDRRSIIHSPKRYGGLKRPVFAGDHLRLDRRSDEFLRRVRLRDTRDLRVHEAEALARVKIVVSATPVGALAMNDPDRTRIVRRADRAFDAIELLLRFDVDESRRRTPSPSGRAALRSSADRLVR